MSSSTPLPGALALSPSSPSSVPAPASPTGTVVSSWGCFDCQYPECSRRAKYGPRNGQPSACQVHKRTGQYTINRHGEVMIATRDGDAFRTPAVAATGSPAPSSGTAVSVQTTAASDQSRRPSAGGSENPSFSSASNAGLVSTSAAEGTAPFRTPAVAATVSPAPSSGTAVSVQTTPASDQSRRPSAGGNENSSSSSDSSAGRVSPSAAEGLARANRSGPSSGQVAGSPAAQNRHCLFPGCKSLPEYGLPGASRAVYCLSHKKGSMVRISREASDLQSNGDTPNSASVVAASNMAIAGTPNSQAPSGEASASGNKKKARTLTIKKESGAKKARHGPKAKGKGDAAYNDGHNKAGEETSGKDGKETLTAGSGPKPAVGDSTATAASKTTSPRKSVSGSPPTNRKANASGMAPSTEMIQSRQAREAAKKEAEAAGGGRRPRAPSRRALEASGRMTDDGAQWMTREKKAEEARVKAELKEQRKQYKAAGLRLGVVLEAFVPRALASGAAGSGEGGSVDVGGGGGSGGEVGGEAAAAPRGDAGWHKVSPAVLSAPPLQAQTAERWTIPSTSAEEMVGKQITPTAAANSA